MHSICTKLLIQLKWLKGQHEISKLQSFHLFQLSGFTCVYLELGKIVRLGIWLGGRVKTIFIIIIIIVMAMHKWASVGLVASHDPPLSSLALLSTDLFWHKMACVRYAASQNDFSAFRRERKHICGSVTRDACRFGKLLRMAVEKRRALRRTIIVQQTEVHQQWNKKAEEKTHFSCNPHNFYTTHTKSIHFVCTSKL